MRRLEVGEIKMTSLCLILTHRGLVPLGTKLIFQTAWLWILNQGSLERLKSWEFDYLTISLRLETWLGGGRVKRWRKCEDLSSNPKNS